MDIRIQDIAQQYINRSQLACKQLESLTQHEVDILSFQAGKAVYEHAQELAEAAVNETGLGNVHDKFLKKRAKAEATWAEIRDRKTVGIIHRDRSKRMIYFAEPIGVIVGVAPCTNPIATAMFYSMICLKTRNSFIIAPHPKAIQCTKYTVNLMKRAMAPFGIPENAIQVLDEPSLSSSECLQLASDIMSMANMVIATGGPKLVDVAYHSGKPAYGVGAGNTPVYLHPSCNIPEAIAKIVSGRAYDNGIICASEQHLITPRELAQETKLALQQAGAYIIQNSEERLTLDRTILDDHGHIKAEYIGKDIPYIAQKAGLKIPDKTRVLIIPLDISAVAQDPYSAEKLCPILSWFQVQDFQEGLDVAEKILNFQGKGHSAAIHINSESCEKDLLQFAERMPATHIIVNMCAATSAGGSRYNWFTPSTTLGCGAYGGTMPMETINLSVKQLINYKAVGMPLEKSRIPDNVFQTAIV